MHIDHHIEIEGHRYSVPQHLVGLLLEAPITQHGMELLHQGQRVAAHRVHLQWTPERLVHWGRASGWPPAVWWPV